jgi:hypothetical protein
LLSWVDATLSLLYTVAMDKRKQINFRAEPDLVDAIEDIRIAYRPVLTVSEAIRIAILDKREQLASRQKAEKQP